MPAKKTATKKTAPKPAAKKAAPLSKEEKLAENAIKMLDEAAALLRSSIKQGAAATAKSREAAKKRAHTLVTKAQGSLTSAISETGSLVQKAINKTLG